MQNTLPEVGKTYAPKNFPDAHMKAKEVIALLRNSDTVNETTFTVRCSDPEDPSETVDVELTGDEWRDQGFSPVLVQTV